MTAQEFAQWCDGISIAVGAPVGPVNTNTLTAWSTAEGGDIHMNPLNTTWFLPGAVAWNTLPSGAHVWSYVSVADAITATAITLLQTPPYDYPIIVNHLRNAVPKEQWSDACSELGKWGTGCGWLTSTPPVLGGFLMALSDEAQIELAYRVRDLFVRFVDSDKASPESWGANVPMPPTVAPLAAAIRATEAATVKLALLETQISAFVIPMLQDIQAKVAAGGTANLQPVLDKLAALTLKAV